MDLFTREHLNELAAKRQQPCVSIYIPTHRTASEAEQDPIRFKNMLQAAEKALKGIDVSSSAIRKLLTPAEDWLSDAEFWKHQSDGLAVFLTKSSCRRYRLPRVFQEEVRVADHFYVNPLLPLLQSNGTFYILAASQNSCRLYVSQRDSIQQLEAANLPHDLRSALGWWREAELNFHSMQRKPQSRGGDESAVFHGHEQETKQDDLRAYFRRIDAGVTEALRGESAPLVFAGVDFLFPLYADVNNYPGLCEQAVTGNPDNIILDDLHRQAWKIVRPLFERHQHAVLTEFTKRSSQGMATDEITAVLTAARDGLVETLVIARQAQLPGRFDADSGCVELDSGEQTEDLLDRAVLLTLRSSGEVLSVDAETMPNESKALALLRAPLSAVTT